MKAPLRNVSRSNSHRQPWRAAIAPAVLVIAIVLAILLSGSAEYGYQLNLAMLAAIGALGLNLVTGYAGQISIGAAAFLAIGAYTVVICHALPFPIPVILGGLAAAIVGIGIGIPSLRLRGLYLLFATLVLQYLVGYVTQEYDVDSGALAGHAISPPSIFGFSIVSQRAWCVTILIILLLVTLFVRNVVSGGYGRALWILRTNESAASVLGINSVRLKLQTLATSSAIIGCAGALTAYFIGFVSSDSYGLSVAISYIAMVLVGGRASVGGSIMGAFFVSLIPFGLQELSTTLSAAGAGNFIQSNAANLDNAVYAALIIVFIFFCPDGLASLVRAVKRLAVRPTKAQHDDISPQPSQVATGGSSA